MNSKTWSEVIKFHRHRLHLTSRSLAQKAGIDPSYITLMERDGHIPSREKVVALAHALQIEPSALLLAAGYSPDMPDSGISNRTVSSYCALIPELRQCLRELVGLPKKQQREAAKMLHSYLSVLAGRRTVK
ncbi:MAG: helix-turn-helix transcriptional regulator [bacterium]|nr:helix-turn-helix transcriptional regulator [bacterium]